MTPVARSALTRLASFLPQAVATLLTTRLIVEHYGVTAYGAFALALALIALVPLNSLGVGVSVTTAYAAGRVGSDHPYRVLLTASRVLAVSSLVTVLGAVLLTSAGLWPSLLGAASGPGGAYGAALAVYALSFVPGLGADVLLGLQRNHVAIAVQALTAPLLVVLVLALLALGAPLGPVLVAPAAALAAVAVGIAVLARRCGDVSWGKVLTALPNRRRHPGARIRSVSGPMMVVSVAASLALQVDRIVLSHLTGTTAVAGYSLTVQIFAPAIALVAAASQPLWPSFAAAHTQGRPGPSLNRLVPLYAGTALVGAGILVPLSRVVAAAVSDGRIVLGWQLPLAAAALVVALAAVSPITATMFDPAGARLLAGFAVLGLVLNVGLSVALTGPLGAAGPLWASAAVTALPAVPLYIRARRKQRQSSGVLPTA